MGMPAVLTLNGTTGSVVWTPDWMQPFFSVGIGLIGTGGVGSATAQATYDDPNLVTSPNWFAVTSVAGLGALTTATFTSPCQGFRLNVSTATATTIYTATLVQATFGR